MNIYETPTLNDLISITGHYKLGKRGPFFPLSVSTLWSRVQSDLNLHTFPILELFRKPLQPSWLVSHTLLIFQRATQCVSRLAGEVQTSLSPSFIASSPTLIGATLYLVSLPSLTPSLFSSLSHVAAPQCTFPFWGRLMCAWRHSANDCSIVNLRMKMSLER